MRIVIILVFLLTSCVRYTSDAPIKEEIGTVVYRPTSGYPMEALEFDYKGHSYIWFHKGGGWDGVNGIVHNPDCPCHNKTSD